MYSFCLQSGHRSSAQSKLRRQFGTLCNSTVGGRFAWGPLITLFALPGISTPAHVGDYGPRMPSRRTSQWTALINCSRAAQFAFIQCRVSRTCAVWVACADGPRALRNSVISSKSRLRWFSINACLLRALVGSGVVRGRGMQLRRRCAGTVKYPNARARAFAR